MAYQIRYNQLGAVKKTANKRPIKNKWIALICGVLFVALLLRLKPVQDFLIPGDPEVTRAAFSSFAQELRDGERFRNAAAVFCRQVIENDFSE